MNLTIDETDEDDDLLRRFRGGEIEPMGRLYERHHPDAVRYAARMIGTDDGASDVVSDAFQRVLAAIANGAGPVDGFRPYLFTAVRTSAARHLQARSREQPSKLADIEPIFIESRIDDWSGDEADLILEAWAGLSPRWREILWQTIAEERPLAEVAVEHGLSLNGAAALAYRAREGLRLSYLNAHRREPRPLPRAATSACGTA